MKVVFEAGAVGRVAELVAEAGYRRVLVISGRRAEGEVLAAGLGGLAAGLLAGARQHVPLELAEEARAAARALNADAVLALGGGSTIGLAKAVALTEPVAVVAVPTSYSGSEMTSIHGVTDGGHKKTGRDPRVRPSLVVYDPQLTHALPRAVTVTSLFNALAHAAESLWAPGANEETAELAVRSVALITSALPRLLERLDDSAAREDALRGAWHAGDCLERAGTALHHKLCHVLGGQLDLPHAETHTVVLPHVVALMAERAPAAVARLAGAVGAGDPARALRDLAARGGAPTSLRALGMPEESIAAAAQATSAAMAGIAGAPGEEEIAALLAAAHRGPL